jgi:ACT domain-containing protein
MIYLEVKIPDRPGSLIELIKPISENGGNIYGILHHHDRILNNMIPVSITFEIPKNLKEQGLSNIRKALKEKNFDIISLTMELEKRSITAILTGHVFDTDVLDTIDRLASKNIFVSELLAKFTDLNEISNVKLKIEFSEEISKENLINELNHICKEKDLFVITS